MTEKSRKTWAGALLAMGVGVAAVLVGAWLLLVPVQNATADARTYDAATSCPPDTPRERSGDCLSGVTATVDRLWSSSGRSPRTSIEAVTADGSRRVIRMDQRTYASFVAKGETVRLVSWRGEVRHVNYGSGEAARTAFTDKNPRTAHAVPLAWALGLLLGGPALVWVGCWVAWLSGHSRRASPWQVTVPVLALLLLAACAGAYASLGDSVAQTLRWTGIGTGVTAVLAVAVCLYMARRGDDTIEVKPRRSERERTFAAVLLGGEGRHSHIVVGPDVLAFTNDPTGASGREPLPSGLVLERVRYLYASDPGDLGSSRHTVHHQVAQCRAGDTEVLIATRRRDMPWLVGALTDRP